MSYRCFLCGNDKEINDKNEIKFTCCGYYIPSRKHYYTSIKTLTKYVESAQDPEREKNKIKDKIKNNPNKENIRNDMLSNIFKIIKIDDIIL